MATRVHHPLFARLYARIGSAAEARGAAEHRDELFAGLSGRVIEVGAGTGLNFRHYPRSVSEVVAVEPEPYLCQRAENEAKKSTVAIRVIDGVAGHLPADDPTFDAGTASLVLCSVDDQAAALAELRRVIRRGGELRFYEHVVSDRPRLARVQRILDGTRIWPLVGGGCHASRDTLAGIEAAGFTVERCRRFEFRPVPADIATAPRILGVARRG